MSRHFDLWWFDWCLSRMRDETLPRELRRWYAVEAMVSRLWVIPSHLQEPIWFPDSTRFKQSLFVTDDLIVRLPPALSLLHHVV